MPPPVAVDPKLQAALSDPLVPVLGRLSWPARPDDKADDWPPVYHTWTEAGDPIPGEPGAFERHNRFNLVQSFGCTDSADGPALIARELEKAVLVGKLPEWAYPRVTIGKDQMFGRSDCTMQGLARFAEIREKVGGRYAAPDTGDVTGAVDRLLSRLSDVCDDIDLIVAGPAAYNILMEAQWTPQFNRAVLIKTVWLNQWSVIACARGRTIIRVRRPLTLRGARLGGQYTLEAQHPDKLGFIQRW